MYVLHPAMQLSAKSGEEAANGVKPKSRIKSRHKKIIRHENEKNSSHIAMHDSTFRHRHHLKQL